MNYFEINENVFCCQDKFKMDYKRKNLSGLYRAEKVVSLFLVTKNLASFTQTHEAEMSGT